MPNYQKGKIYTIRNYNDATLIQVGSTTQTLSRRMSKHRTDCKANNNKCCIYKYIINNDWSNFYIELYEYYPCNTREELLKREGEVIREIGTCNKRIEGRTPKEYYDDNADKIKQYKKEWGKENAEKIKEQKKEYYEQNVDKIKQYKKQYREKNAEKRKEYDKQYREKKKSNVILDDKL